MAISEQEDMELSDQEPGTRGYGQDEWIKLHQSDSGWKPHVDENSSDPDSEYED